MAIWGNMYITNAGQALYAKAQAGKPLNFTKLSVGSGQIGTQNPVTLITLIQPKYDVPITGISPNTTEKLATIRGVIDNTNMTEAAYICELGLWAEDPDAGEILYGYTSAGTQGDYMAPASQGAYTWMYEVNAAVGNAANITANITSLLYDYAILSSDTTFNVINGGNQKEINKSIDSALVDITNNKLPAKVDKSDYVANNAFATTSGTSTAYTVTLTPAPTAYADGQNVTIVPHVDCGATPTLNVNNLGALTIVKQDGTAIAAGDMKQGKPYSLVRIGSNFFIRSGGGGTTIKVGNVNNYITTTTVLKSDIASPTKLREIKINVKGMYRITFNGRADRSGYPAYMQIYKNGSSIGILRTIPFGDYVNFTEDLSVNEGDLIQLYGYINLGQYSNSFETTLFSISNLNYFVETLL